MVDVVTLAPAYLIHFAYIGHNEWQVAFMVNEYGNLGPTEVIRQVRDLAHHFPQNVYTWRITILL